MDRKKIIKDIEDGVLMARASSTRFVHLYVDSAEEIVELLKEQEAVEPKKENDGNPEPWTAWWYVCGDCGQPIDRMDRYCRGCGKQVKWE